MQQHETHSVRSTVRVPLAVMVAIADLASAESGERAREACKRIAPDSSYVEEALGTRLLRDLRAVWPDGEEFVATHRLLDRLHNLVEAPWSTINRGNPIIGWRGSFGSTAFAPIGSGKAESPAREVGDRRVSGTPLILLWVALPAAGDPAGWRRTGAWLGRGGGEGRCS